MSSNSGNRVIVLCGFMGTGKTAAGYELAQDMGVPFFDTDAMVEKLAGKSAVEIFAEEGEAGFRQLEIQVCQTLRPTHGAVIATGGGMVGSEECYQKLSALGPMILLEASIDTILERTARDKIRPLLAASEKLRHRIEELLAERAEIYDRVELRVNTTSRTIAETIYDVRAIVESGGTVIPLRVETQPLPDRKATVANTRLSRIVVQRGAAAQLDSWLRQLELGTRVCFMIPESLEAIALERLSAGLVSSGIESTVLHVDDGDDNKKLGQVAHLLDELAETRARRDTAIVAVGGGVTGDIAGFVASLYMRGLPLVHIPTTLLAQVDSSIGGKTGVNTARAKNLVGSVYQPHLVLTDPDLLVTLPQRQLANGMAEVIKTAMLGSAALFSELVVESKRGASSLFAPEFLERCVAVSARVKGRIVEMDPYERDLRRVLNLGHTVGHALETAAGYGSLEHGEAVSLGLLAALRVSTRRARAMEPYLEQTRDLLEACGLPIHAPDLDRDKLKLALSLDKKRISDSLNFVLPLKPGSVTIVQDVTDQELLEAIE